MPWSLGEQAIARVPANTIGVDRHSVLSHRPDMAIVAPNRAAFSQRPPSAAPRPTSSNPANTIGYPGGNQPDVEMCHCGATISLPQKLISPLPAARFSAKDW